MTRVELPTTNRLVALVATIAMALAACGADDQGDALESGATSTTDLSTSSSAADGAASTGDAGTEDDIDDATDDSTDDAETTSTTAEANGTTAGDADPGAASTTEGAPARDLVPALGPDGLILVEQGSGTTSFLDFGTPTATVLSALESAVGSPDRVDQGNPECSNGQAVVVVWDDLITLDFDSDDQFLAWMLRPDSKLTTMTGVGLGSTRQEVEDSIVISVEETSLGTEFTTDAQGLGLSGLFEGRSAADPVQDLWAGQICAFR